MFRLKGIAAVVTSSAMFTASAVACPICDTSVVLDAGRAACFLHVFPTLQALTDEPVFVNFVGCSADVLPRGVVNVLGPVQLGGAGGVIAQLDDVAFLTKDGLRCLKEHLDDRSDDATAEIILDCK